MMVIGDDNEGLNSKISEMASYAETLSITNFLQEPVIHAAIQALQFPHGSRGLDAGCGIGLQTLSMAEAIGTDGYVTGLDLSPELLEYARINAEQAGLTKRVEFKGGDVKDLPFESNTFDWAWSANLVGYAPLEPLSLVKELVRVVKPGGIVAILAWSSEKLLPGYPLLEARLSATKAGLSPFAEGKSPENHFLRALGWFDKAGLVNNMATTFAGSVHAPLSDDLREALITLFEMRWPEVKSELSVQDWVEFERLCNPDSDDFIDYRPDYYAFYTYSMFHGLVVK
jgi:demethylmenaquinone methyltransferase/2-methoxy-6-polyprenyl-1,4-benzoquinol methylase